VRIVHLCVTFTCEVWYIFFNSICICICITWVPIYGSVYTIVCMLNGQLSIQTGLCFTKDLNCFQRFMWTTIDLSKFQKSCRHSMHDVICISVITYKYVAMLWASASHVTNLPLQGMYRHIAQAHAGKFCCWNVLQSIIIPLKSLRVHWILEFIVYRQDLINKNWWQMTTTCCFSLPQLKLDQLGWHGCQHFCACHGWPFS